MDIVQVLAVWVHTLALVIAMGYYGVLGRMVLPALQQSVGVPAQAATMISLEKRALPFVLLATVLFILTGTYLLFVSPSYAGLGNFFASTWTTLMLIKHGLVIVFIALGVALDLIVRRLNAQAPDTELSAGLRRVRLTSEAATGMGALIILLTAAAQLSA
jgi:uncharacterized membrane protein